MFYVCKCIPHTGCLDTLWVSLISINSRHRNFVHEYNMYEKNKVLQGGVVQDKMEVTP